MEDWSMPVGQETWWTRLRDRLRGDAPSSEPPQHLPDVGDDGLLAEPVELAPPEGDTPEKPPGALTRWTRRDQTLVKLQEGYERVTQVVEEVQKHLATQGERTERICVSLEQLARSMADLPGIAGQQAETLQAIAGHLETTNARTQQLTEVISEVPKTARTQSETLAGIRRQLEMTGEQNLMTSQSMERLGSAIGTLNEFNSAQVNALRDMNAQAADQNELLRKVIAKQSKRFTMLFIVTVVLAAAAIVIAAIAILARTR
jgi:hypothetical protein